MFLGLGNSSGNVGDASWTPEIRESQVLVPSDMFALTDARILNNGPDKFYGGWSCMDFSPNIKELTLPRHGAGYNVVCCDGHVGTSQTSRLGKPHKKRAELEQ